VVDDLAAPGPLDHRVGEPEDQDVLHRLLAEVMVDPEHLRLVENSARDAVELARACQVMADRLLNHDPRLFPEPRLADPLDDRRKGRGRRRAIEEPPAPGAKVGVEGEEALAQRPEGLWVVERRGDVGKLSSERLPASVVKPVAGELLDPAAGPLAEVRVVEAAAARADDRVALRQQPLVGQVVEGREQLAARQIAGRAEDDDRLPWWRGEGHGAHPSWWSRLYAALISARWVKAWGKLPSCSPVGPISSEYRPTWLA
jgi:hypothetical protein